MEKQNLEEALYDETLLDALNDGARFQDMVMGLSLEDALALIERAKCGRPRAGASRKQKWNFVKSHMKDLLPFLKKLKEAQQDLLNFWFAEKARWACATEAQGGCDTDLPWPKRFEPLCQGDTSVWSIALFAVLNAKLLESPMPDSVRKGVLRIISTETDDPAQSDSIRTFDDWYLRAFLSDAMSALARADHIDLEELQDSLSHALPSKTNDTDDESQEIVVDSRYSAVSVAIGVFGEIKAIAESQLSDLKNILARISAVAEEVGWSDKLDLEVIESGLSPTDAERISDYLEDLDQWINSEEILDGPEPHNPAALARELVALVSEAIEPDDLQQLNREVERFSEAIEAAGESKTLGDTALMRSLACLAAVSFQPDHSDWVVLGGYLKFNSVIALREGPFEEDQIVAIRGIGEKLVAFFESGASDSKPPRAGDGRSDEAEQPDVQTDSGKDGSGEPSSAGQSGNSADSQLLDHDVPKRGSTAGDADLDDPSPGGDATDEPESSIPPEVRGGEGNVEPVVEDEGIDEREPDQPGSGLKFSDIETASLARQLLDRDTTDGSQFEALIWKLVADERVALALYLAESASESREFERLEPVRHLLECVGLSKFIWGPTGSAVEQYRSSLLRLQDFSDIFETENSSSAENLKMVLFSALLRPAILAQYTGATGWLDSLKFGERVPELHQIRQAVLEFTRLGLELSPSVLKGVREQAAWEVDSRDFRSSVEAWLTKSRDPLVKNGIRYPPAAAVWRFWLKPEEPLGKLITAITEDDRKFIPRGREILGEWGNRKNVVAMLHQTDKKIRPGNQRGIDGQVIQRIFLLTQDALGHFRQWLEFVESEPSRVGDYVSERAQACRSDLLDATRKARLRFERTNGAPKSPLEAAGISCLESCTEDIERLMDPDVPVLKAELANPTLFRTAVFKVPGLELSDDWIPVRRGDPKTIRVLLEAASLPEPDWLEAFSRQLDAGNHFATSNILDFLSASGDNDLNLDDLRSERDDSLAECRRALNERIIKAKQDVELGVSQGVVDESTRASFLGILEGVDPEQTQNFRSADLQVMAVSNEIARLRTERAKEISRRLVELESDGFDPATGEKVRAAIENGHLMVASEYLDNPDLVEESKNHFINEVFERFFPNFTSQVQDLPQKARGKALIDQIRNQKSIGPINMSKVPGAQAASAARMLSAWFRIKAKLGDIQENTKAFLSEVGFDDVEVGGVSETSSFAAGEFCCRPVVDREICPVPFYGSQANGRYGVVLVWDRPSEEELFHHIREETHDAPLVVLYLGRLTDSRRIGLAQISRRRQRTFLVLDEALVYFLCMQRDFRLPVMFHCALPFTAHNPYTTTAGLVPDEMFFGRKAEAKAVMDRLGTNLVFGGRQLGKTALLRHVVRRNHNLDQGIIARWVDLKVERIGPHGNVDEIWNVIAGELQLCKVIPKNLRKRESQKEKIKSWLAEDSRRRIVLLLDEADEFLEADRRSEPPFSNVNEIKGLMDDTDRRFKVVFAGLHDVQRTSHEVNSSLAHFGTPVCIGPLLDGGEWREADALIRVPLGVLGYKFESDDLPVRILSYTNYYPSLIQLFCKELVNHLTNPRRAGLEIESAPMYTITSAHVEGAFKSENLRKAIRDRVEWTLELDPRYRYLAFRIALECHWRRTEQVLAQGLDVAWIQQEAISDWADAFAGKCSTEDMRTMLDEMIGLGILRKVGGRAYSLRSANVLNLLGSEEKLQEDLTDSKNYELPPRAEPKFFRRPLGDDWWVLSPITADQEGKLLLPPSGAAVLFGNPLSGIENVTEALRRACQTGDVHVVGRAKDCRSFISELESILKGGDEDDQVITVPPEIPWSEAWVEAAAAKINKKRRGRATTRIIFVGDSSAAWSWSCADQSIVDKIESLGIPILGLRPWTSDTLHRWLGDQLQVDIGDDGRNRISFLTGRWSSLLYAFANSCSGEPLRWSEALDRLEKAQFHSSEIYNRFAVQPEAHKVLCTMAELNEPVDLDTLTEFTETHPFDFVARVVRWAELLFYVAPRPGGCWEINALLRKALLDSDDAGR